MSRLTAIVLLLVISAASATRTPVASADRVIVYKGKRELVLMQGDKVFRRYKVALGTAPVGRKLRRGDGRTPEGVYVLDYRNTHSQYYKSIHISYPNAQDRAFARRAGVDPGGDVFIHGLPNGMGSVGAAHRLRNWTLGCIAVTDSEIDEIWSLVRDGTPIEIRP